MKKLIALLLAALLCVGCTAAAPASPPPTGEDNIKGFVTALFTLPFAEVEAMPNRDEMVMTGDGVGYLKAGEVASKSLTAAAKPYANEKLLETLADKASNTPGLMFMLYEVGYTLKVDNVYAEAGKDREYTAFVLLELTDPNGMVWHGLVDINLRLDDSGKVEYWKVTDDGVATLMSIASKLGDTRIETVNPSVYEEALLR